MSKKHGTVQKAEQKDPDINRIAVALLVETDNGIRYRGGLLPDETQAVFGTQDAEEIEGKSVAFEEAACGIGRRLDEETLKEAYQ